MARLVDIEGIGQAYADRLKKSGIQTIDDFLAKAATPGGRKEISEKTGISPQVILEWTNQADLMTIDGIGPQHADLLEEAGVDTVPELALRDPGALHDKMIEVNDRKRLVSRVPSEQEIAKWVRQALRAPRRIRY